MRRLAPLTRPAFVALALLMFAVGSAQALPGDPPILSLSPSDGATVPADANGLAVTFRCPAYTKEVYGDPPQASVGNQDDYDVIFARSPQRNSAGLLSNGQGGPSISAGPGSGTCTARLDSDTSQDLTGRRVFWQAHRSCIGCEGQRPEAGPVRSFVVKPPAVKGKLEVPRRLYAGYLSVFTIATNTDVADRALLQRRVGRRWRTVIEESVSKRTQLITKLPAGRQTLRAVLVIGSFKIPIATRKVNVRRGGRRFTSARDDGKYVARKRAKRELLGFRVVNGGRVLKGFKSSLVAFCFGPTVEDNRFVISFANLRSVPVAPDGSVVGQLKLKDSRADVTLIGRLRGRRFKGTVSISFSTCNGQKKLDAVRAR